VTIKKKNGKQRKLNVPTEELKTLQRYVLKNILCYLPVSRYATAYKKGVSLTDNASPHVNKKYILKMDVTDFFGSITFDQVYNAAFNTKLYPKQIGYMLTCLCCHKDVLPQGAPTSPAVSNLVMKHFDDTIGAWCNKRGIAYTRYCDDMTFSADKPLYAVYEKARSMLENIGMELNEKKTCFVSHGARQAVTGLVVNEKVSVPREYKRKVRQELYYLYKYGAEICRIQTLIGKIRYIISVEKNNNIFINELDRLMEYKANLD
jgi:retron-type reverse transcriptase